MTWREYGIQKITVYSRLQSQFRLQRRMTFPFVLADRYDPKEAYKHTYWAMVTDRKFFHATQSETTCSLKHNFLCFYTAPKGNWL